MTGLKFSLAIFAIFWLIALSVNVHADREKFHCMDVNRDGQITVVDALAVAQVAVGLRDVPDCSCKGED